MGKVSAFVCVIAMCTFLITSAETGNSYFLSDISVCGSPPEMEGAIAPRLVGMEHPLGTAIIYNCPVGYVNQNSAEHISTCKKEETSGRAAWSFPKITCNPHEMESDDVDNLEKSERKLRIKSRRKQNRKIHPVILDHKGPCVVPLIENGIMGKYETLNNIEEFKEIVAGEEVNSGETLLLHCTDGLLPVEDSKVLPLNRLEVTCIDRSWSNELQCKQTSCTEEPPAAKNAFPVIASREHGFHIWYRCNNHRFKKVMGSVKCHFGSWIGTPPECLDNPCNTGDLNFPGVVEPLQKFFDSDESFEIICEAEYRKTSRLQKITCVQGKWNIMKNPCSGGRKGDRTLSTTEPGMTTPGSEIQESFCTYDYQNPILKAQIGHKILKQGDEIMRGETVSVECYASSPILKWQNGLRSFGEASMICSTGQKWQSKDLPSCNNYERSDAVISFEEDMKILPGGIVNMQKSGRGRFVCSSGWKQPEWDYGEKKRIWISRAQVPGDERTHFISILDILEVEEGHSGRYECFMPDDNGHRVGSTFLHLQVNVSDIRCPPIHDLGVFSISYSNGTRVNSTANLFCLEDSKKVEGSNVATCLANGTWSLRYPICVDRVSCPRFPDFPELQVTYSKSMSIGSVAAFSCSLPTRNLIGSFLSVCEENGSWSNPLPSCKGGPECSLNLDPSSNLLVEPMKDSFRFGEFVLLSCPPGYKLSRNVQRLMCLGNSWSEDLPGCEKSEKSDQY